MDKIKDQDRPLEKKVYKRPGLTVFGHIRDLTKGGVPSAMSDHGMDMMSVS